MSADTHTIAFCHQCGQATQYITPEGDDRPRPVCTHCGTIHYQNPRIVVGTIPASGKQVLLCRRAIEPCQGLWTLPAGFLENGESTREGALRETWEEAKAQLDNDVFYCLFDLPHINQVYIFYRGDLVNNAFDIAPESSEVALFTEQAIPWDNIAFPVITRALQVFFKDQKIGHYPVRVDTILSNRI